MLQCLPCIDDDHTAEALRTLLGLPRHRAAWLAHTAVTAAVERGITGPDGHRIDLGPGLDLAMASRRSIPPDSALPQPPPQPPDPGPTQVQVVNTTTLQAAQHLHLAGQRPLALNLANGVNPGGGFLHGARAQEESLCRASLLHATLDGDPMYAFHQRRPTPDSSDWLILSPDVPVFRDDAGTVLPAPWPLSFLTGAAPYAPSVGQQRAGELMATRVRRALAVAHAHGFRSLVLGAWGCGAFRIDPQVVARHFRDALEEADGRFDQVVFAISDWSPERRFLGPFRDRFAPDSTQPDS